MMTISLLNFFIVGFIFCAAGAAPARLVTVRDLISEKKTKEAIELLRLQHHRLIKNSNDLASVDQWMSVFIYEDSMASYEAALERAPSDVSQAQENFEQLLIREPHNKIVHMSYIRLLLEAKNYKKAQEKIEEAKATFPYFSIFSVYSYALAQMSGDPMPLRPPYCDKLKMAEAEFCHLMRLVFRIRQPAGRSKLSENELKTIVMKSQIPEAQYWLWEATQKIQFLKNYLVLCQNLSEKDKKNYRIVPSLCAKMPDAEKQLQKKKNEESSAPPGA